MPVERLPERGRCPPSSVELRRSIQRGVSPPRLLLARGGAETQPLFNAPWPLLRAWGESDLLVPPAAYQQFAHRVRDRPAPFCDMQLAGADHGLQLRGRDGIQWLWTRLENWSRSRSMNICASLLSPQLLQEGSLRNVPIGTASVTGAHLRQRANLESVGADGF